jgi:hypothetical protein
MSSFRDTGLGERDRSLEFRDHISLPDRTFLLSLSEQVYIPPVSKAGYELKKRFTERIPSVNVGTLRGNSQEFKSSVLDCHVTGVTQPYMENS